jgi:hypothetical protein
MTRYRVELAQTVIERAVVWIEATNKQQAEEAALAQVTTGQGTDIGAFNSVGDIEVLATTEQQHDES